MIEVIVPAGPWIVIDASEAGEVEQGSAVLGGRIKKLLAAAFRIDRNGLEPFRQSQPFAHILLKKCLAGDAVGIAAQNQRPAPQKWQDQGRDAIVVRQ